MIFSRCFFAQGWLRASSFSRGKSSSPSNKCGDTWATETAGDSPAAIKTLAINRPFNIVSISRSLWRRNRDVAELQAASVVALDIERTGLAFVGVERSARNALDFLMIHGEHAVVNDGHRATDEGDIECLPLAWCAGNVFGCYATVDGTDTAFGRIAGEGLVFELNFVAAAQVKAAIGV